MSNLTKLIERVEKATGPDADLNDAIKGTLGDVAMDAPCGDVTESLDAAIALCERVLPDANCWGVESCPLYVSGYVSRNNVDCGHWIKEAEHKTAPLALILAMLRAMTGYDIGE